MSFIKLSLSACRAVRHVAMLAMWVFALSPANAADWMLTKIGYGTSPLRINEFGQVTGVMTAGNRVVHAFVTGANGLGITDLGSLNNRNSAGYGINDGGQVVGYSSVPVVNLWSNEGSHGFVTNAGVMTDLGTLGVYGKYDQPAHSIATDINNSGQIVGSSSTSGNASVHAFITGENGNGMRDIGTLGGNNSSAEAINATGQVTGDSVTSTGTYHAFITGPNGSGMTDIGTLGGAASFGTAINNSGQVAGWAYDSHSANRAFVTGANGVGMRNLGTLGGDYSRAWGINDFGQVVGASLVASGEYHAFLVGAETNGMMDLNSAVQLEGAAYFMYANDINNRGQIIAIASDGYSYLLSPIPEPEAYVLFLAGLGLLMARRRHICKCASS